LGRWIFSFRPHSGDKRHKLLKIAWGKFIV
jgi:hypothetical protein